VSLLDRLARLTAEGERGVLFTVLTGPQAGAKLLALESGETLGAGPAELAELLPELVRAGRNRQVEVDGETVFCEVYAPPPRLFVYGAVDTAESLARAAKLLGWHVIVADARPRFATRDRMPSADELIVAWPEEAFAQVEPDHSTAVVVLTHDEKFDQPAIMAALRTEAFYVGALGSRRNQEKRRVRLLEDGVAEADLDRISGPCGLDIGADTQAETALSILAEVLAARTKRGGGPLRESRQRIHVEVE
jgi:xanthine dehydrogenase accessory factor